MTLVDLGRGDDAETRVRLACCFMVVQDKAVLSESETTVQFALAARTLLAREGFAGLSLRATAEEAGATFNALSYHIGSKLSLVGSLIEYERVDRQQQHSEWKARAQRLAPMDNHTLAAIIEAFIFEAAGPRRESTLAVGELLLAAGRDPSQFPGFTRLLQDEEIFWKSLVSDFPGAEALGTAITGYCFDEALFAAALSDDPDYRILANATIARIAAGLAGQGQGAGIHFDALTDALAQKAGLAAKPFNQGGNNKRAGLAEHIADLIEEDGVASVTHRAVARRAGAANSTVAHHFRRRDDLLHAGIESLYLRITADVASLSGDRPSMRRGGGGIAVLRATHAVAIEATRNSAFRPFAFDMRRQRSINVREAFGRRLGGRTPLDPAGTQAAVISLVGSLLARDASGDVYGASIEDLISELAELRTMRESLP